MTNQIDVVARRHVKSLSYIIDRDVEKVIRSVNNDMYSEAMNMYDTFIKQFYSYRTTSYVRHWEGVPGTGEGQNLYFGKDIRKYTRKPKLIINLPGDAGYESNGGGQAEPMADDYRFNTAEEVLGYVYEGIRFPEKFGRGKMEWSGSYKGHLFSYSGTMRQAFNNFNMNFDKIALRASRKYLKALGYY